MSRSQLFGLAFGFALIFFVAICPPWYAASAPSLGGKLGRGFLWTPPKNGQITYYSRVDGEQLFAEITVIFSLTGLVVAGLGMTSIRSE